MLALKHFHEILFIRVHSEQNSFKNLAKCPILIFSNSTNWNIQMIFHTMCQPKRLPAITVHSESSRHIKFHFTITQIANRIQLLHHPAKHSTEATETANSSTIEKLREESEILNTWNRLRQTAPDSDWKQLQSWRMGLNSYIEGGGEEKKHTMWAVHLSVAAGKRTRLLSPRIPFCSPISLQEFVAWQLSSPFSSFWPLDKHNSHSLKHVELVEARAAVHRVGLFAPIYPAFEFLFTNKSTEK